MKKALLLVYSDFKRDSRVIRHYDYLVSNGFDVDVLDREIMKEKYNETLLDSMFFYLEVLFAPMKAYERIYKYRVNDKQYDLIIANDWNTLPLAFKFKLKKSGKVLYDSHEYGIEQKSESVKWKLTFRRIAKVVERIYINRASTVITVNREIRNELKRLYNLDECEIIRNIPSCKGILKVGDRGSQADHIRLYHHGKYIQRRKLETVIDAALDLSDKFRVSLRMDGSGVKTLSNRYGKTDKIVFLDMLPPDKVISGMDEFDLGIAAIAPVNMNHVYSLSNKFFEYLLAGIPVIVSKENVTMARYVREYGLGFISEEFSVKGFKKLFEEITFEQIQEIKKNVADFALELLKKTDYERLKEICDVKNRCET